MKQTKTAKTIIPLLAAIALMVLPEGRGTAAGYDSPPSHSWFFIKAVMSKNRNRGYWDQPGRRRRYRRGANLAAWAKDGYADQQFRFIPAGRKSYYIVSRNGGYADVKRGRNRNGVSIQIWSARRTASQKFRFKHLGQGRWKIYTAWNRVICLAGRRDRNGTNIHTWTDHRGPSVEWYFIDSRTGRRYLPRSGYGRRPGNRKAASTEIRGKLKAYDFDKKGKKQTVNPGARKIEVWYFDRKDRKNPYKKKFVTRTDKTGKFSLGKRFNDYQSIFLISRPEKRSSASAVLYPKRNRVSLDTFISKKYHSPGYVLVDTYYRGKQYYYEKNGMFYRENGIITRRYDFYFHNITQVNRDNPAVKKLIKAIGGSQPARTDNEIAKRIAAVYKFFKTSTKNYMGKKSGAARKASNYMFKKCREKPRQPVKRWPSFKEMADTYARFGFLPVGNCTANTQIMATLLYMAGVPEDKFFVAKYHYDMSWFVEHWVIAVNIGKRWYSLDPQHKNVIRIKSAADFKDPRWERYISKRHDYKKPFEAWLLPGSHIKAVPYLGDPKELRGPAAGKSRPEFFIKNKKFNYSSSGPAYRSSGSALVQKVIGNTVYLRINSITGTSGKKRKMTWNMTLTFRNGLYRTGRGFVYSGRVDATGKILRLHRGQSSITLRPR